MQTLPFVLRHSQNCTVLLKVKSTNKYMYATTTTSATSTTSETITIDATSTTNATYKASELIIAYTFVLINTMNSYFVSFI